MSSFEVSSKKLSPILRGTTYSILKNLARSVITPKVLEEFSLEEVQFQKKISLFLDHCSPQLKGILFFGLWFVELGALFFHARRFTKLSLSKQSGYVGKWSRGSFTILYLLFRPLLVFIYSAYYSHPPLSTRLGFHEAKKRDISDEAPFSIPEGIKTVPKQNLELQVEICVIGSGAGGAVVARELAKKGHEVLILEEGGYFGADYFKRVSTQERNLLIYRDAGLVTTLGAPMILLPTGKCVGGTTVINSGTCFRTPPSVFKKWHEEFGLPSSWENDFKVYFDDIEKILGIEKVSDEVLGGNNSIIKRGIEKLGLHGEALKRDAPHCRGSGVCIFGCPTGAKQSMERSYLPLAFEKGAKLYPHCRVLRLHSQHDRVYKIDAVFNNPQSGGVQASLTVYPKIVVVACGTLETPLLLKRSRLGNKSGQLGKNLTIHPTAKMMGIFEEKIDGFSGVPQGYGMTDYQTEGMMFETVFFPPWLLATSVFHAQEKHREIMENYRHAALFGFLVHDGPRGRVFEGIDGRPLVWYVLGKKEKALFARGLKILGQILFAAGAKRIYPTLRSIHELKSLEELEHFAWHKLRRRDLESAAFHPLGTCRMGMNEKTSVVDENLRLHGMKNIWVADGSVFPTSLGVNPQITIMAFAARCADQIHEENL